MAKFTDTLVCYPCVQVRFNKLLIYNYIEHKSFKSGISLNKALSNIDNKHNYSGNMTKFASKNIRRKVDLLLQRSPIQTVYNPIIDKAQRFRLVFVTLTIPQQPTEPNTNDLTKKLLKPFLRWLVEVQKCVDYIYKLEFQQNGSPHWHITTNKFIRYDAIKDKWNKLLYAAGLLDSHFAKYGNYNPNSTDIHAVSKIKNVEAYLVKYLSKSEQQNENYKGKVWGCSDSLRNLKHFAVPIDNFTDILIRAAVDEGLYSRKMLERCTLIEKIEVSPLRLLTKPVLIDYKTQILK